MKYTEEKKKLESLGLENRLQKISKDETVTYQICGFKYKILKINNE